MSKGKVVVGMSGGDGKRAIINQDCQKSYEAVRKHHM